MIKRHSSLMLFLLLICFPLPINAEIRIFGLEDFKFGKWELGDGPLRLSSSICVAVRPRGPYQVTAYGSGSSNTFTLTNGSSTLPFRMYFNDLPRPNGATELQPAQALGGLRGRMRGIRQRQCNRPTANIGIRISDTDLRAATAGQYSGTVVIIVGPE